MPRQREFEERLDALLDEFRDVAGPRLLDEDGELLDDPQPGLWACSGWVVVADWQLLDDSVRDRLPSGNFLNAYVPERVSWAYRQGILHVALMEME